MIKCGKSFSWSEKNTSEFPIGIKLCTKINENLNRIKKPNP